jgi:hypothetical protein
VQTNKYPFIEKGRGKGFRECIQKKSGTVKANKSYGKNPTCGL